MSATRERTRRAILDAAVRVLGTNRGASLADVAAEAGVGRTTLHRYFPERAALLAAINDDALERSGAGVARAQLGTGSAMEALERLCVEHYELGPVLLLVFSEPEMMSDPRWQAEDDDVLAIRAEVRRGQAEGSIDPALPPTWIEALVWSVLYTAWSHAQTHGASRHEALSLCLTTLRRSIAPA